MKYAGKKLFLTTDAHSDWMELVMCSSLGSNWKDHFDIIVAQQNKPFFIKADFAFNDVDPIQLDTEEAK